MDINVSSLHNACDRIGRICCEICETKNNSSWLFDNLIELFESDNAIVGVTIPVTLNEIGMKAHATIGRDGSLVLRRADAEY